MYFVDPASTLEVAELDDPEDIDAMSREPIEPWKTAMVDAGIPSISALARAADVSVETARRLVYGMRARPQEATLRAVADALRVPASRVGEWAGMALTDDEKPYDPPAEASMLSARERAAVDEVIRVIVAAKQARGEVKGPSVEDVPYELPTIDAAALGLAAAPDDREVDTDF